MPAVIAAASCILVARPAAAGLGYTLAVASDDRFRGATTSDGRAVATAALSIDDASGLYAGVTLTAGIVRGEGVRVLSSVQQVGYVHRVDSAISVDVGAVRRAYDRYATVEYGRRVAEVYAGLVSRRVSAHLFHAPDYDGWGHAATYLQLDGRPYERGALSLFAHVGALRPPRWQGGGRDVTADWRLGATCRLDRAAALSLAWIGAGDGYDRYSETRRTGARRALVLSVSRAF